MKAKNHEKLAGFRREFIDSETPEKPVKSRIFGDLQGVKNAHRGLLLSERPWVRIPPGTPREAAALRLFYFGAFMQENILRFFRGKRKSRATINRQAKSKTKSIEEETSVYNEMQQCIT